MPVYEIATVASFLLTNPKCWNLSWSNVSSWWRHQMETFSALLAICAGNSPVPGEFPTQSPVTRSFDVYFDLRPNKRLSKQSWGWWFETLSCSLWRHRNEERIYIPLLKTHADAACDLIAWCLGFVINIINIIRKFQDHLWKTLILVNLYIPCCASRHKNSKYNTNMIHQCNDILVLNWYLFYFFSTITPTAWTQEWELTFTTARDSLHPLLNSLVWIN